MATDVRTHVMRGFEAYNRHDPEMVTSFAPDAVEVTPLGTFTGREAIADKYASDWTAFPDAHIEPATWTVEGETAVVEYTITGTHTGPLIGPDGTPVPPTGNKAQVRACSAIQVRDGHTVSHRVYYDLVELMTQLGLTGSA